MELIPFLVVLCVLLCVFSAFQAVSYVRLRRRYLAAVKAPPAKETLELTAQDLLHDLTRRGQAVLRVEVIDPANILLRSPRG